MTMGIYDQERLRNPIPNDVRNEVRKRAENRCEDCGIRSRSLELHHLTYKKSESKIGLTAAEYYAENEGAVHYIFGHESADDLALLCRDCHKQRHMTSYHGFFGDIDERNDMAAYEEYVLSKDD